MRDVSVLVAAARESQVGAEKIKALRQCVSDAERTSEKTAATQEVDVATLKHTYDLWVALVAGQAHTSRLHEISVFADLSRGFA